MTHPLLAPLSHLPIASKSAEIVKTVCNNRVTIITAPTGQGKTMYVSLLLYCALPKIMGRNAGLRSQVIVTEPRRLACRSAATYLSSVTNGELGQLIGYKTAFPDDSCYSVGTKLLFCTDGLQMVRELLNVVRSRAVLVIDEIHEWNINMEVLVAWAKKKLSEGADFRLVIMSATMNSEKLSSYFWNAPIISSNERRYNVTKLPRGASICADVATRVALGESVLVFQPGKEEVYGTIETLKQMGLNAEILPLHGELSVKEQNLCFQKFPRPLVIVATPVAQTSITPPVTTVIDSGLKRELRCRGNVECLSTVRCSLEDGEQRDGRAGRTQNGFCISHAPTEIPAPKHSESEIERISPLAAALRIYAAGHKPQELEFFHAPKKTKGKSIWSTTDESLMRLGCLTQDQKITNIGLMISKMATSVQLGRAIVESLSLGIRDDMIAIAAIISVGGITQRGNFNWQDWVTQSVSDAVAALQVYKKACQLLDHTNEDTTSNDTQSFLEGMGIDIKRFRQAQQLVRKLDESIPPQYVEPFHGDGHYMESLRQSLVRGFCDHVYVRVGSMWVNGDSSHGRRLSASSVIDLNNEEIRYLVGLPFDINTKDDNPEEATNILTWATVVTPDLVPLWVKRLGKKKRRRSSDSRGKCRRDRYHNRGGHHS